MIRSRDAPGIMTVGHSSRTLEEFVTLLRAHEVGWVLDVRKMPRSRKNPQFNQETLRVALGRAGIGYCHIAGLGGFRRPRPDSPNGGWQNASFQGYADYMLTPEFRQNLQIVLQKAIEGRVALMCAEAVPWRCHRSLIADSLAARGFAVGDILSADRCQAHRLVPWAFVKGTQVTYPPSMNRSPLPGTKNGRAARSQAARG